MEEVKSILIWFWEKTNKKMLCEFDLILVEIIYSLKLSKFQSKDLRMNMNGIIRITFTIFRWYSLTKL